MSRYTALTQDAHEKTREQRIKKVGVLLANLGTPDAPTPSALRTYLAEFLSDPRVVEIPRIVWKLILHGIILRVRPAKSAKLYQKIWTEDGSPLLKYSELQRDGLSYMLKKQGYEQVVVKLGMRYGNPSIVSKLQEFQEEGISKIVVLPLYPQHAGPTTASVFDAVVDEVKKWRWIPELHFISGYHDNPDYINALCASIRGHIQQHHKPKKIIFSYHGMPKLFLDNGDPYYCFCLKTTRLVAEKLGLQEDDYVTTFQSRFGKAEWLKPYTDDVLEELAGSGVDDVAVICPAFSADCLETLEEIAQESAQVFKDAGGKTYHYIPALNDSDAHLEMMLNLVNQYID